MRECSSVSEQPVGIGSHEVAHRSRFLAEFRGETQAVFVRGNQSDDRDVFADADAVSCRLRTFNVCWRQPKHSSTFCRKPSSNVVVTQGFVFSHHEHSAESCHAVRVTLFMGGTFLDGTVAERDEQHVAAVTHESLPASRKGLWR